MASDYVVFILSHGRADNVITYDTLRRCGYTGRVVIVIDDEDDQAEQYIERFGKDNVQIFSKAEIAQTFDEGAKGDRRTIVYARNACFDIAIRLGYTYFIELDDDYTNFSYRFKDDFSFTNTISIKKLDNIFAAMLEYYQSIPALSIAMMQGGDFLGGEQGNYSKSVRTYRKAMNSFICSTERRFNFVGRINEDVNTYTTLGSMGYLFLSTNQCHLLQKTTQSNKGGMTDVYCDSGTYLKTFFTVMYCPSSVKVSDMRSKNTRIHHRINWNNTAPKIIRELYKKH